MSVVALVSPSDVVVLFKGGQFAVVSPVVVVYLPGVTLLFEGGQSAVVPIVALASTLDVMLLFEGGDLNLGPGVNYSCTPSLACQRDSVERFKPPSRSIGAAVVQPQKETFDSGTFRFYVPASVPGTRLARKLRMTKAHCGPPWNDFQLHAGASGEGVVHLRREPSTATRLDLMSRYPSLDQGGLA